MQKKKEKNNFKLSVFKNYSFFTFKNLLMSNESTSLFCYGENMDKIRHEYLLMSNGVHKIFSLLRRIDMRLYIRNIIYKAKNFYAPCRMFRHLEAFFHSSVVKF